MAYLDSTAETWLQGMYETFALGAKVYLGWAVIVLLCLPWFFMWARAPINFWGAKIKMVQIRVMLFLASH